MPQSTTPRSTLLVPHSTDPLADLLERDRVTAVITALFVATDDRDWDAVARCFADSVHFDMESAGGGAAGTVPAGDIVTGWRQGLAPIEHVHHQAGNFRVRVTGPIAEAHCHGIAYHYRRRRDGRNTRVFVGTYDFALEKHSDGWRITAMRFALRFIDGNPALEAADEGRA